MALPAVPGGYDSWNDYIEINAPALASSQGITLQQAKASIKLLSVSKPIRETTGKQYFRIENVFTSWAARVLSPTQGRPWAAGGTTINYALIPSALTVLEGASVTFGIATTGVASDTILYWTNSGTTVAADFLDSTNSGYVTLISGAAAITKTLRADRSTEGNETIIINLRTGSVAGPIVATSSTVTVTDSSTA